MCSSCQWQKTLVTCVRGIQTRRASDLRATQKGCRRSPELTVVGRRLFLQLSASYASATRGSVVLVLLLVFDENLTQQLLWRREGLTGDQLTTFQRHTVRITHNVTSGKRRSTRQRSKYWEQDDVVCVCKLCVDLKLS